MKLSVIIPCFNGADTITTQLEALANQQWSEPWEVIVADNGSTDNSIEIVEQYKGKIPNLRVVDASDQRGAAHARNVGARVATGESLAFCDADDEVAPGWVAAMGEALSKYDFVAGRLDPVKLNEPWVAASRYCPQQNDLQNSDYLPHAAGCNLGIKRTLFESIGDFDVGVPILDDADYCWRVQRAGTKLHYIPEALVHYRFRNTLSGIYDQARKYGKLSVLLRKKHRELKMPESRHSQLTHSVSIMRVLCSLLRVHNRAGLGWWLWRLGWYVGKLRGEVEYRN
jgi:glycosyltransferase involved in cell wall biosynthesis